MISVLLASPLVQTRGLYMPLLAGADPYIRPGRRDHQLADTLQHLLVLYWLVVEKIGKTLPFFTPQDTWLLVVDIGQMHDGRRFDIVLVQLQQLFMRECNIHHAPIFSILPTVFSRSIPFPSTGLKISPISFSLSNIFLMVKCSGFSPFFSSSQCRGVETVAPGRGRIEYGAASVWIALFCRKSRYIFFFRLAGVRSRLVKAAIRSSSCAISTISRASIRDWS